MGKAFLCMFCFFYRWSCTTTAAFIVRPSFSLVRGVVSEHTCAPRPYSDIRNPLAGFMQLRATAKKRNVRSKAPSSKKKKRATQKSSVTKLPRLIIFDLDGCLWKPELYELLICQDGAPFSNDPKDKIPGTCLLSKKGHRVELLADTRQILYQLYSEEEWYPSRVGISSRTDPPEWAHHLIDQFSIYNKPLNGDKALPCCCFMKEVFDPSLCILDKTLDKATQFEMLLQKANNNHNKSKKSIQFKDVIFFDNEAGNCKQVARLGVTCVYTPRGVTYEAWENGLQNVPANRVLGPKLPY